ncbi:DUF4142 domain-containing protein [Chryseolinea sp. T2]|uniref:DUF4142 domain-containing protein n=1 Tax=Chryseolinea sp. T2 TaxID=3129255 RepID=UPI003078085A
MRNAIVFINICIVAAVTMLLMQFDTTTTLPADVNATGSSAVQASSPTAQAGTAAPATSSALATVRRIEAPASKRALSESEVLFVKTFINEMSQARMLGLEQSRMAVQRGTTRPLKDYGAWMVINQEQMLRDLKRLAKIHKIKLPEPESMDEISGLHGRKFDSRYIRNMTASYKRDLKLLERAGYSTDPDVQVFAARYATLTRDNFTKLRALER